MHRILWMGLLFLCTHAAMAGPIYRCIGKDGALRFSDVACPGHGEALAESTLSPNAYDPVAPPESEAGELPRARAGQLPDCNPDAELRHLDLLMSSLATSRKTQSFLRAERRRVQNCRLADFSAHEKRQRDSALERTGALRDSDRIAAQQEIEALYARHGPLYAKKGRTTRRARRKADSPH